ncbi:MAG: hypothetical protein EPO40_27980 [Myxococcaceae bacterium]|nr:MAG: hypothetical protein EPO40_27980 [Myxococcaceae bacterium]
MTRELQRLPGVRSVTSAVSLAVVVFTVERAVVPNPRVGISGAVERAAAVEGHTYTARFLGAGESRPRH